MDYQDLLQRARAGTLPPEAWDEIAAEAQSRRPCLARAQLLHILSESPDKRFRPLFEKALRSGDPEAAKFALQTLCVTWGETRVYSADVLRFLRGVKWDTSKGGHVLLLAVSVAGEYLRAAPQPAFLAELIDIYEKEESLFKDSAYVALGRALGHSWPKVLMKMLKPDKLLDEAKKRLAKEAKRD
ncbi:MAG: hypothetical protein HXY40_17765 [Chloroflexi bacterium]|nr:hypothetical protein [Chloroflexota bacterium]